MSRNIPKIFLFCLNIYKYICFNILFRSGNGIAFLRTRPSQAELGPLPLVPRAASPPKCNTIAGTEQDQVGIEGYARALGVIRRRAQNNEAPGLC